MRLKQANERTAVDVINAVLGAMLVLSPWIYTHEGGGVAIWSVGMIGLCLTVAALGRVSRTERVQDQAVLALGLLALAAPWVLGFGDIRNIAGMHVFVGLCATIGTGIQLAIRTFDPSALGRQASAMEQSCPTSDVAGSRGSKRVQRAATSPSDRSHRVPGRTGSRSTRPAREAPERVSVNQPSLVTKEGQR